MYKNQGRMTWRHDSVLNCIVGFLMSALRHQGTVVYCDLDEFQALGGGTIPADVLMQTQRLDLVILDRSVPGRKRISLVELTCPWDTNAREAEERKASKYADLKASLENQGWGCSLYTIEVGARGHIFKLVKDCIRSLFRAWVPADSRSGVAQLIKHASWISLVCSFSLFHAHNDPHWIAPCLVEPRDDGPMD